MLPVMPSHKCGPACEICLLWELAEGNSEGTDVLVGYLRRQPAQVRPLRGLLFFNRRF